jgi:hypothetical protein
MDSITKGTHTERFLDASFSEDDLVRRRFLDIALAVVCERMHTARLRPTPSPSTVPSPSVVASVRSVPGVFVDWAIPAASSVRRRVGLIRAFMNPAVRFCTIKSRIVRFRLRVGSRPSSW